MLNNKKLNTIVTELFIIGKKLNISRALITQSYFAVSKKNQTKLNTLFCYESSKQKTTSSNCI